MSQFSIVWFSFVFHIFSLHLSVYYFFSSSSPAHFLTMIHKLAFLSEGPPVCWVIFAVVSPEEMAKAPPLQAVPWHIFVLLQTLVQIFCFPELLLFIAKSEEQSIFIRLLIIAIPEYPAFLSVTLLPPKVLLFMELYPAKFALSSCVAEKWLRALCNGYQLGLQNVSFYV